MTDLSMFVASINEAGFIANLDKKGFNFSKSLSEIYANSIDAHCNTILTKISNDYVYIIDDGNGMNTQGIKNMFDVYRENHTNDTSMGISGIGAKASLKKISLNTNVIILTKHKDNEHLKIDIPWEEIVEKNKYTGMIKITSGGKEEFEKHSDSSTGTIIKIKNNEQLTDVLVSQFEMSKNIRPCSERFDIIFSKFEDVSFKFKKNLSDTITLDMYRPFEGCSKDYYTPITQYTVRIYPDGTGLYDFVLVNDDGTHSYIEKSKDKSGQIKYGKKIKQFKNSQIKKSIGEIDILLMIRRDDRYFNPDRPEPIPKKIPKGTEGCSLGQSGWGTKLTKYDNKFFHCCGESEKEHDNDTIVQEYLSRPDLIRNGQKIDKIVLPNIKFSSARAGIKQAMTNFFTRCEVKYTTESSITNELDKIFGIQENKNQINQVDFDPRFTRLIEEIYRNKGSEMWTFYIELITTKVVKDEEEKRIKIEDEMWTFYIELITTKVVKEEEEKRIEVEDEEQIERETLKVEQIKKEPTPEVKKELIEEKDDGTPMFSPKSHISTKNCDNVKTETNSNDNKSDFEIKGEEQATEVKEESDTYFALLDIQSPKSYENKLKEIKEKVSNLTPNDTEIIDEIYKVIDK